MSARDVIGIHAMLWADIVADGCFFVMQIYLTEVWGLSFTTSATLLNIWGGIHRILPIFCLFLADTILGNVVPLALSGIFSTAGFVLISVTAAGGYTCRKEGGKEECVGHTEKALFITGMALVALGKAHFFASFKPFIRDNIDHKYQISFKVFCVVMIVSLASVVFFAFPYVRKWYVLWLVAASCWAIASLLFVFNWRMYASSGPRAEGSPVTDFVRVLVASAINISQPSPKLQDNARLHVIPGQEFNELSASRFLGFLHKAAIKPENEGGEVELNKRSWRLCTVSEVESAKVMIRMVTVYTTYLMCGVVSSTGNTYFVEQATHMTYSIGSWKPPIQLLQIIFMAHKFVPLGCFNALVGKRAGVASITGPAATVFSILCCTVAAAVERRRLHVVRRHDLAGDARAPMTAFWLLFQASFFGIMAALYDASLQQLHDRESPEMMERYKDCLGEGVRGLGYICGALSVYVVGKLSDVGSRNKSWFQPSLNRSRLDRYYWVLSVLCTINLGFGILVASCYRSRVVVNKEVPEEEE